MNSHKDKRLFISGIPTSGKSYLADKLAKEINGIAVHLDHYRIDFAKEEKYRKWTDFLFDKNEYEYLTKTTPDHLWKNLVAQSEGLWPAFSKKIEKYKAEEKPVVFECVNILPHIAKQYLDFPGIVLIGNSYEIVLERNKQAPRLGKTPELQALEARWFFEVERPHYKAEAEKYKYPVFESADEALEKALQFLKV